MGLKAYLELIRPLNTTMTGLGIVFAVSVYTKWSPNPLVLAIGFITGFCGTAAAMTVNDVADRSVDAINKPWKPIPSGRADPVKALTLSIALLAIAVLINTAIGPLAVAVAAVYGAVAFAYSFSRKHWWSQLLVPLATTAPIIYGYSVAGMPSGYGSLVSLFSLTIFTASLGREVLKAVMDVKGDKACGYATIPIRFGIGVARKIIALLAIAAPILGVLTGILAGTTKAYYALMSIASILYGYSMLKAVAEIDNKATLERSRRYTLYSMLVGLIAFLFSKT